MDIEVTAYENVKYRYQRLERVVGYICALADWHGDREIDSKIERLFDYKGVLEVHWLSRPSKVEMKWFEKAWESSIGDGCDNVEHYVRDVLLPVRLV